MSEAPLVLKARIGVNALGALGLGVMVAACAWGATAADDPLGRLVFGAFAVILAPFAAALVLRVLDRRPAIVVDAWGVRDRRSKVRAPWSDITRVWIWEHKLRDQTVPYIALDVRDPDAVRPGVLNRNPFLRGVARAMGAPPVMLNAADLTLSQDALFQELQRRLAARRASGQT